MNELSILQQCIEQLQAMSPEEFKQRRDALSLVSQYYTREYADFTLCLSADENTESSSAPKVTYKQNAPLLASTSLLYREQNIRFDLDSSVFAA